MSGGEPGVAGGAQSPSAPPLVEVVRRNNEEMAEMVAAHPDRFAGFVAATPVTDPDAVTEEAIRSVRELGAFGVQLDEDAINLPLHEDRYDPLFAAMEELRAGVWLHPFRTNAWIAGTGVRICRYSPYWSIARSRNSMSCSAR